MDTNSASSNSDSDSLSLEEEKQFQCIRRLRLVAACTVAHIISTALIIYADPFYNKVPYHTLALSGADWVCELLNGHSEHICNKLGVHKHVFYSLIEELKVAGYGPSQNVYLEEQLAIFFIYMCHWSLPLSCLWTFPAFMWDHIEVSFHFIDSRLTKYFFRYFVIMLLFFSSELFYTNNIHLPHNHDPVPPKILENPKFFLSFKDALGAINGTHINCSATGADWQAARDRKGSLTQNCLTICSFNLKFLYIFSGWEGQLEDARITNLPILQKKYYLADAGFPI